MEFIKKNVLEKFGSTGVQEVLNKNYRSFDPYNDASMSYAISSFLEKPTNNSNKELLKKYSFEKMTKETTDLYKVHLNL